MEKKEINTEIYQKVIGQIIRHALTAAAVYFAFVGVDKDSQSEFVRTTADIVAPLVLFGIAQGWGYLQKRTAEYLFRYALRVPAHTSANKVKELVAAKEPPPVEM